MRLLGVIGLYELKIREIRKQKKISLSELGRMTEISKPMLSRIENGQRPCDLDKLDSIASVLHVMMSDLYTEI